MRTVLWFCWILCLLYFLLVYSFCAELLRAFSTLSFVAHKTAKCNIIRNLFFFSSKFDPLYSAHTVNRVNFAVTCYSLGSVLEAFGLTCAVTTALTVYTLQSKRDFSAWGAGWVDCTRRREVAEEMLWFWFSFLSIHWHCVTTSCLKKIFC